MTENQFQSAIGAAETFKRLTDDPMEADFWSGYIRGSRRLYHGDKFGTAEEHDLWMKAGNSDDESRRRQGAGYMAGFNGLVIEAAITAAKGGRT